MAPSAQFALEVSNYKGMPSRWKFAANGGETGQTYRARGRLSAVFSGSTEALRNQYEKLAADFAADNSKISKQEINV
jgi:hypothetical protein